MKKIYISTIIVLAFVTASFSSAAAAVISQLTNNFSQHQPASTANGHIAWWAWDGNDSEIYYWDGKKITQITNNSVEDQSPSLSFKSGTVEIAWHRFNNNTGFFDIWYWNGTTETQITNSGGNDIFPSLHNGTIAWYGGNPADQTTFEIYFWDGNNVQQITNNAVTDWQVSNYNGNLAWAQWDNQDYEIIYRVGNTMTTVTNNNQNDSSPSLYDGAIAWYASDGNDNEIYFWDGTPGGNPFLVTNNSNDDLFPSLFKDTIAWSGWDGNDYELYYWDGGVTTKVTNNNTPDVSVSFKDGLLAYQGQDKFGNWQVFNTEAPEDPNVTCEVTITGLESDTSGRPAAGEKVKYTASVKSGCRGDIFYKFYWRGKYGTDEYESAPWNVAREYSTNNSAEYIFPEAGDYIVVVRAVLDPSNEPAALPIIGGVVTVE
jgi:hypothetical protein